MKRAIDKLRDLVRAERYQISVHANEEMANELIYVDHVPVWVCRKCGELYFDAAVYKRLEKIAEGRNAIRTKITFPLADYRKALVIETR